MCALQALFEQCVAELPDTGLVDAVLGLLAGLLDACFSPACLSADSNHVKLTELVLTVRGSVTEVQLIWHALCLP